MAQPPAPIPVVEDRAALLLGISWMWTSLATIFVAARFYCRIKYQRKVWWDDWWALLALVFSWAMSVTWTVYAKDGGAQHFATLTPKQIYDTSQLNWISQPFCIWGLATGKISVAALIKRIQSPNLVRTIILWVLVMIMVLYDISVTILIFTQCSPVQMLWDPFSYPNGHCLPPNVLTNNAIGASSYMAFLDLALAAVAVEMVWKLQMDLRRKLAICALLSTGIFAFIMGVIKITELGSDSNRTDLTWATVLLFVWNACEVNVVIVAACVPTLMSLFEAVTGYHPTKGSSNRPSQRRLKGSYGPESGQNKGYYFPGGTSDSYKLSNINGYSSITDERDNDSARNVLIDGTSRKVTIAGKPNPDHGLKAHGEDIVVTRQFVANTSNQR